MDREEILLEDYKLHIDLYKFYFNTVLKFNVIYYLITAGILSYYFTENLNTNLSIYLLFLPLVIGALFSIFFVWGAKISLVSREHVEKIALELGLEEYVEYDVLRYFLILCGTTLILVSSGIFGIVLNKIFEFSFICSSLIFLSINIVIALMFYFLTNIEDSQG